MRTDRTACILCSRNCGLEVQIEGRRLARIQGDDAHPVSKGYICQKAARLEHYQSNRDRLEHPLERQPDGTFARVSWDEAITKIAARLRAIRDRHGGKAFALVGGGGQGNHLGGAYGRQMLRAMRSRYAYNSLGQEKTGDFWVNGRLFGSQKCHTTEDVEHADYVLFVGTNPFQAHGIPNARDTLKAIQNDPRRTMVVIDPRRTETAKMADVHLQLRPGTDAYLLAAMLAIIVREGLHDRAFLAQRCTGFDAIERALARIDVADYVRRADVPLADVERVARGFATARSACVRIDLGIQHTLHTTLNGYLEKLLYLLTGNFGRRGGNNLHTSLLPILGDTDERSPKCPRTARHGMHAIAGIFPPNILADEILHEGEDRVRAVVVDSSNPLVTYADTDALERAFSQLELLVVVDVAMTETARLAHFVLPAASQFEKWEATGFNLEFPKNAFHLRHPLLEPLGETLPEPEIYTRLLEAMGEIPKHFPVLERVARIEPRATDHALYLAAFAATIATNRKWMPYAASILYRTLGPTLDRGAAAAAPLLPLAIDYARTHADAVRRAGHRGRTALSLGAALFRAILDKREGVVVSAHEYDEMWRLLASDDRRIHLEIPEMLEELGALESEVAPGADHPFVLMAGERRAYNANQIYRDPAWRRVDPHGAMRMHPEDAAALGMSNGARATCTSERGSIDVVISIDDTVRRGVVVLPHGYGMRYGGAVIGPEVNRLTSSAHCDRISRTPFHKYVPVHVAPAADQRM
ncbi:molybdopterin-dependent oxidoreductase [Sandaracinus amylolyticus]|uniref:molybdopterin-dependent oxidoreductase n=1 Tax=Sandaracinus amylolyticus TaxID=927083 RepID=UPI001F2CB437|nr:molybdopterin-dependent oxidoreductase [Sandaracinus amylolyticus]UJR78235.1 Anaerobic selenocysteine-containing dehydrogenase [Sandaracinus amylolyticus]